MTCSISSFRSALINQNLDGFIIGSGDAHQSEYVQRSDMRRTFISNFTGSAGTALVLKETTLGAYLWTDGRYFLQASNELPSDWTLMKSGQPNILEINDWIVKNMSSGSNIGVDAKLISAAQGKAWSTQFSSKNINLIPVKENPVDKVWGTNRPQPSKDLISIHSIQYAGKSYEDKIYQIQQELKSKSCVGFVVSMLDEIAWLLNIRGSDVSYNPIVMSYVVVTESITHFFVDPLKVSPQLLTYFDKSIIVHSYEEIDSYLIELSQHGKIMVDPTQINWHIYTLLDTNVVDIISPIQLMKAIKNTSELQGIRDAHTRDGVALTAFLHYLDTQMKLSTSFTPNNDNNNNNYNNNDNTSNSNSSSTVTSVTISEYDVVEKLEEFRGKMKYHVGPSFSTIAGYGANGAIIHYKPEKNTAVNLSHDSLFLLDSGAQYKDGTTDVTRTMHYGTPTAHMMKCYTAVLKGHIALASAVFPEGTLGSRLDCIARLPLWEYGLDYNHGTGHGVGAYLNVHEGPQGIGFRKRDNESGFFKSMTISNEPGYYENGNFGIRIENVCVAVAADTPHQFNDKKYLKFDTVTMVPIETHLIDMSMMTSSDITWINTYHTTVQAHLLPYMQECFPDAVSYLLQKTAPIGL